MMIGLIVICRQQGRVGKTHLSFFFGIVRFAKHFTFPCTSPKYLFETQYISGS
jgi:hypothetical protein